MKQKSIKMNTRLLTCLVVLAVVFATFIAGTFTSNADEDVFGDIELKVGDTLGFVYYTEQPYTTNTTMRFTVNGRTSTSIAYPNDGKCVFIFNDIYPHELAKEVTATIVVNGKDVVTSPNLSIKEYLLRMLLNPNSTTEEKQFASDTLQYGEQTRLYRNMHVAPSERDEDSITDDINPTIYTAYNPRDIETKMNGTATGLGISASNIRMSSIGISYHNINRYVVTLQVPTGSSINPQKIKVVIGNKEYTADSFIDKGDGKLEVHSDAINAYDIMEDSNTPKTTQFKLYVNGKIVQQASYNVLDYIYQLQDTTANNHLALYYARSLYRYGQSAKAAYKGNRIVSITLKTNPGTNGEMVPSSKNAQTPLGGAITAYYSDGSSQVISEGITWKNKDINGKDIKITDDTHTKTFTVQGAYTDTVSNKTYTVTGQITLHNDMTGIARYTDPTTYAPTSYASSYTPTGSVVRCTWANGYQADRVPTHSAITMTDYATDEYGFIPTTATYTDPKSGETKTVKMYLYYQNPIKSITVKNSTATFNGSTSVAPVATTYTVTFTNGKKLSKNTSTASWTTTIQNGDKTATKTYTYSHTNVTYAGTNITASLTSTGTLSCPAHGHWTAKSAGQNSSVGAAARDVTDAFTVAASNPETAFTFSKSPSIVDGTVLSTSAPSGSTNSTTSGQLSGGTTYVTYANGKTENVASTYTSDAGITNTAYSKSITVTASYTDKDGGKWTATRSVTVYNTLKSISQKTVPTVEAESTTNVQFELSGTKNTLTATYNNGKTATVGDGTDDTTNIYLNGKQRNDKCYVESIATAEVTNIDRNTAGASDSTTSRYSIKVVYTDDRSGSNQATAELTGYKVKVYNTYAYIENTMAGPVYMTGANQTPTPSEGVIVKLSNGQPMTAPNPTFTTPASVTTAKEYETKKTTISVTASDGTTITKTVSCVVVNKAKSAAVNHTNPSSVKVSSTSQVQGSSLSGGKITVTFTNGQSDTFACTSYTTGTDAAITNTATSKTVNITGTWTGKYSSASATQSLTLTNPADSTGSLSVNNIVLTTSSVTPSGTLTVTHSNGQSKGYSVKCSAVYPTGTTSSGTATTDESGSCSVSASKSVDGVAVTASGTCSWTNPVTKLEDRYEANRTCPDGTTTVTLNNNTVSKEYATATLNNGAEKKVTVTITYPGEKDNVSGYVAYQDYYVSASYGGKTISSFRVRVYNPLTSISVTDKNAYFAGNDSDCNITITATAYRKNGASKGVNPTLTKGTSGNPNASYNVSGNMYMCSYSGSSWAKWKVTGVTATYEGLTDTFDITYTNDYTVKLMVDGGQEAPDSKSYTKGRYPYVNFTGGSTTSISSSNAVAYLDFNNGAGYTIAYNHRWVSAFCKTDGKSLTHDVASIYINGDDFGKDSLVRVKITVKLDGVEHTDYGYVTPTTSLKSTTYTSEEIKLRHTDTGTHHVRPSCWKSYLRGTRSYNNSKYKSTGAGYYHVTSDTSNFPFYFGKRSMRNYYSVNGTSGLSNVYGPYTIYKTRTVMSTLGWLDSDGALVCGYPNTLNFAGYDHTASSSAERYSWPTNTTWMGY